MCVNEEIYQDNPTRPNFPNYPQAVCPQDLDQEIQKGRKLNLTDFVVQQIKINQSKYPKHNCAQFSLFICTGTQDLDSVESRNGKSCCRRKAIMRCSTKFAAAYWSTYLHPSPPPTPNLGQLRPMVDFIT